ncbi:MAG: hypothetical protein HY697_00390 [Deltaproteobacteria bacterium]|nr:hypothetical protein [Deltaproteobacteria bacterium]
MEKELTFLDSSRNRRMVRWALFGTCAVLLILGLFMEPHGELYWEKAPNFFAAYGFLSCVSLILIAKGLRILVKREEHYYDR